MFSYDVFLYCHWKHEINSSKIADNWRRVRIIFWYFVLYLYPSCDYIFFTCWWCPGLVVHCLISFRILSYTYLFLFIYNWTPRSLVYNKLYIILATLNSVFFLFIILYIFLFFPPSSLSPACFSFTPYYLSFLLPSHALYFFPSFSLFPLPLYLLLTRHKKEISLLCLSWMRHPPTWESFLSPPDIFLLLNSISFQDFSQASPITISPDLTARTVCLHRLFTLYVHSMVVYSFEILTLRKFYNINRLYQWLL